MRFSAELLNLLPAASRAKIVRLLDDRAAAHAALLAADEALFTAHDALARIEAKSEAALAEIRRPSAEDRARLTAVIAPAREEVERRRAAKERAAAVWASFAFLDHAARWVAGMRNASVRLRHVAGDAPAKASHPKAVEQVRAALATLDEEWSEAEEAPATLSELRAATLAALDEIAERGRPAVDLRHRGGDPARLHRALAPATAGSPAATPGIDFVAWAARDVIAARLLDLLGDADAPGAMTFDQREDRFADIDRRRLDLARLEEAHIAAAEAAGQRIARRPDADPRAVLEVGDGGFA